MAKKVIVAGGGASGLVAAVTAAENGARVTVLEHKDRVGKKILMTGNGKCNLTNMSDVHGKYYSSDTESLEQIYDTLVRFDAQETRKFFQRLGLYTKEKRDGGVYPVSEQASIVLDVLRSACSRLGVTIRTDCALTAVLPKKNGGIARVMQEGRNAQEIAYDRLILATGGKAAPVSGSDGSGYVLAKNLGHRIIEPLPALVQLRCEGGFFKALSGVRAQGTVRLLIDGTEIAAETGELQLTDYGISGIPVFQLSRLASRALYDGKRCEASLDFISYIFASNALDSSKIDSKKMENMNFFPDKTVEECLSGLVHKKIAAVVCKQNGIAAGAVIRQAGEEKVCRCIKMLSDFRVRVAAPKSFDSAQVCCGGVALQEVDEQFMSRRCHGLYLAGELLDCDGICGGFNLQWAWATGHIAGEAAARQ